MQTSQKAYEIDLDAFKRFAVYIDENRDGLIDFVGPTSGPESVTQAKLENGAVVLENFIELEGDTEVQLLLVGLYEVEGEPVILEGRLSFIVGLVALGALLFRSRKMLGVLACSLCLILGSGCGTNNDFVVRGESSDNQTSLSPARDFQTRLPLDQIEAVGRIDGEPIQVEILGDSVIDGPW